ncbi:MAG: hypothetical protein H0T42_22795 [Deltaproteobacteria bacterium]|nr:hypothetical protein [Deltaproteobacteria bacterium]
MLMVAFTSTPARAQSSEPLKPYVVFMLDTSGSMVNTGPGEGNPTGSGPPSCGGLDNRLNHAKCAINKIVNSYGDMVFALGRFRETPGGTFANSCDVNGDGQGGGADQCTTSGVNCAPCSCNGIGCAPGCTSDMRSDHRAEMLTSLVDGNNQLAGFLTDNSCGTCSLPAVGAAPTPADEIWGAGSWTPLGGTLLGAHRYWQGLQATNGTVLWPSTASGFDPIRADPKKTNFLPTGCNPNPTTCVMAGQGPCCAEQCRPYITILLTDGDETCGGNAPAAALAAKNNTIIDNRQYRIETKVIGLGRPVGDADIEAIAVAGSLNPDPLANDGFYANDEQSLQLAISQILDDAIRTELCNTLDDDCDSIADEGFTTGGACNNGLLGQCRVVGSTGCRADGAGTQCNAGRAACVGIPNGNACTVVNATMTPASGVAGTCQGSVCVPTARPDELGTTPRCNNLDDDCDGLIDEGVTGCTCSVGTEICDGDDDDCDGNIDENTSVPCANGTCVGVQPCNGAAGLGACTAATPGTEVCNGIDDTCDGIIDGFQQACSNMDCPGGNCSVTGGNGTCNGGTRAGLRCDTFPAFDPRNNPGGNPASLCQSGVNAAACVCNPGNRTCPLNGPPPGTFTACVQEIQPGIEICNLLDDDCDGLVDETPAITCTNNTQCAGSPMTPTCINPTGVANAGTCRPADCSINSCGGELRCVAGVQTCTAVSGTDNTCNGVDEDCDMSVDEHWLCADPDGVDNIPGNADDCPCTANGVCNAKEACENGGVVCTGDPVGQEACNCLDDNCNGQIDEGTLCGAGATCTSCQCAFQCIPGEFACPMGKACIGGFCLADPCFNFTCPVVAGDKQICRPKAANPSDKECVSACAPGVHNCNSPNICFLPTGECKPDNCTTFPAYCTANQNCINGTCVSNPCQGVTCAAGQNCVGGQCFGSCAGVDCPDGQRCRLGVCETNPCNPACPAGQVCQDGDGSCIPNPCGFVVCPQGQYCNANNGGMCEDDPCDIFSIVCATGEVCVGGTCFDENDFKPDAGGETHVTTGGGGGCSTNGDAGGSLLLGLGLVMLLRRRRVGGAS